LQADLAGWFIGFFNVLAGRLRIISLWQKRRYARAQKRHKTIIGLVIDIVGVSAVS
jgi:hypothetical protein